ncbi:MAG: chemotaxis protein CheV [Candidatus Delongbacteria bacterium]|nr:chemotaxis protein CheV [Candidatus Delongbacteria bacterium]MBN2834650.1 chemotaxis protein CheV [Candidatus Delongbacteria bacterium]
MTNDLKIVEFTINDQHFGLNVAKVQEIIIFDHDLIKTGSIHEAIRGVFDHRDQMLPLIDISIWLGNSTKKDILKSKVMICEFNGEKYSFLVDNVLQIRELSWKDLENPQKIISTEKSGIIGVIRNFENIIVMLDVEKIIDDISSNSGMKEVVVEKFIQGREDKRILIAEDSPFVRKMLYNSFYNTGYKDITIFENGKTLFEELLRVKKLCESGVCSSKPKLIITDLEMPQISGDFIIKELKEDKVLSDIPILVFSSLTSSQVKNNIKNLDNEFFVSKPNIGLLIKKTDEILFNTEP